VLHSVFPLICLVLFYQEDGTATFQRYNVGGGSVRIGGSLTIGGDKFRTDQTQLTSYCYELVENYEDPLAEVVCDPAPTH